jgi:hypothetical protein
MAGKMRSPNYPALTLAQAVEGARKLWASEQKTAVNHDTAALAMGYKSLSGPARVAIGSMRQYGLIEKAEKGHVRLSPLAVTILHGDETERIHAMAEAATTPDLFRELGETHLSGSENAIRSHLITKKGFAEDGARKAARAFRESIAFAQATDEGYNQSTGKGTPEDMTTQTIGQRTPPPLTQLPANADGVFSMTVPFAKGSIAVQVRVTGDAMSPAHLARVRKYLELAEQDWGDSSAD